MGRTSSISACVIRCLDLSHSHLYDVKLPKLFPKLGFQPSITHRNYTRIIKIILGIKILGIKILNNIVHSVCSRLLKLSLIQIIISSNIDMKFFFLLINEELVTIFYEPHKI